MPRGALLVLLARPARRREPSATVWRLLAYDRATLMPVADVARRWQPAGTTPATGGAVPGSVAAWVAAVLGPGAAVGSLADDYAGPSSWHVITAADRPPSAATAPAAPGTGGTGRAGEGAPVQS